jgi:NADH-quinone oxidoreductase subunit N
MNTLIAVTGLGVLCLLFEIFSLTKYIIPMVIIGLLAIFGLNVSEYGIEKSFYSNSIHVDKFSVSFSGLFIVLTTFLVSLSHNFYENQKSKISDFVSIKLFLLAGAIAMVSFQNMALFFLGIEILSISLYILAASKRLDLKSNEAGMKYFLLGSFASAFILFGICLIYGAIGSFDIFEIKGASDSAITEDIFYIGGILLSIGMLFKIAAVPFHFWAPDVYEGSPALTTATMSTLAKVVAMATFYKIFSAINGNLVASAQTLIVIIAGLSMSFGNIMALRQANVKRMLAFSGISHAGFMLITLLNTSSNAGNLLYYTSAYSLAGIAAFCVILYVCKNKENEDIVNFHGLGKTHPILALILTCALFSMAGIPIFSGFFAKLFLFNQAINSGFLVIVIIGIINSIISVGYYFKLILVMYTKESNETRTGKPILIYTVAIVAILMNIVLGFFPSLLLKLI